MARSILEIGNYIREVIAGDPVIAPVAADTSKVADWRLWTDKVADSQHDTEVLYDAHKAEVQGILATEKPHKLQWYVTKAKAFQYGDALPADSDVYDPVAPAGDPKYVVAFAAAVELSNLVRIKAAKLSGGVLAPLSGGQLTALTAYMGVIKDAGVRLQLTSGNPDDFRLALGVFYDPLILDATGARLDGTSATPVQDAVNAFLDNLPFNGLFVLNYLIEALQAIEGVRIGEVIYCAARYGAFPYAVIPYEYVPDAGYMLMDAAYFLANTTYTAHGPI